MNKNHHKKLDHFIIIVNHWCYHSFAGSGAGFCFLSGRNENGSSSSEYVPEYQGPNCIKESSVNGEEFHEVELFVESIRTHVTYCSLISTSIVSKDNIKSWTVFSSMVLYKSLDNESNVWIVWLGSHGKHVLKIMLFLHNQSLFFKGWKFRHFVVKSISYWAFFIIYLYLSIWICFRRPHFRIRK